MKIAYIHQYYQTPMSNGGTRSYEFARRLVEHGHEVNMITSDPEAPVTGERWRTTVEGGVTVHRASVPYANSMAYGDRLKAFFRFSALAARRAGQLDQDIVFATSTPLTVAIPGAYSAWRHNVPLVLEVRDLWPATPIAVGALRSPLTRRVALALEAWAYRRAEHVVALSPDMADGITGRFPETHVSVIPNGCDLDVFGCVGDRGTKLRATTPWLGGNPLVVYAGAIGRVNGVGYLVKMAAACRAVAPSVRFAVIGVGRELPAVHKLAEELGVLGANLFLLDAMSKRDVAAWFAACDLAVSTVIDIPELSANSANKVFDGWAAGRPVAVNHRGWLADVIADSGAGLVLPPVDTRRAAELLSEFLNDRARVTASRVAATNLARGRFSRDRLAAQCEEILVDVARTRQQGTDLVMTV